MNSPFIKHAALTITLAMIIGNSYAQIFTGEVYSGYLRTQYFLSSYSQASFSPIGVRAAAGWEHVQFGVDFSETISRPTFIFYDPYVQTERLRETYQERYLLGYIRYTPTWHPAANTSFVMRLGAGIAYSEKDIFLPDGSLYQHLDYNNSLCFMYGMGMSIPFGGSPWHLTLEYQIMVSKRTSVIEFYNDFEDFIALNHGLQIGFSFNFMPKESE